MEKDIEQLVADILLPKLHLFDFLRGTDEFTLLTGTSFDDYLQRVEIFVAAKRRDYGGFRNFLDNFSEVYHGADLCNLSNKEIDSIFETIQEYQGELILEKLGLSSDES
ncbi:hypothetical protein H8D91_00820 [archaeon]|nr:hypothetical protein [archaeon]